MTAGVVLYGAPASGKDTVTAELTRLNPRFQLFERLKEGPGRTTGYRMVTREQFDHFVDSGEVIWWNARYNARYAIDRTGLLHQLSLGRLPVIHAGQPKVIHAVEDATPGVRWVVVELQTDRDTAHARIVARATGDTAERLHAWEQTPPLAEADLRIDTSSTEPETAARAILALVMPAAAT